MTDTPKDHSTAHGISDSIKGKATEAKGKMEELAAELTGKLKTQAKGKLDEAKGEAEDLHGKVERSSHEKR
jgi:uncharacterized protein YjbJ (UPF0337 family)